MLSVGMWRRVGKTYLYTFNLRFPGYVSLCPLEFFKLKYSGVFLG